MSAYLSTIRRELLKLLDLINTGAELNRQRQFQSIRATLYYSNDRDGRADAERNFDGYDAEQLSANLSVFVQPARRNRDFANFAPVDCDTTARRDRSPSLVFGESDDSQPARSPVSVDGRSDGTVDVGAGRTGGDEDRNEERGTGDVAGPDGGGMDGGERKVGEGDRSAFSPLQQHQPERDLFDDDDVPDDVLLRADARDGNDGGGDAAVVVIADTPPPGEDRLTITPPEKGISEAYREARAKFRQRKAIAGWYARKRRGERGGGAPGAAKRRLQFEEFPKKRW